MTEAPIITTLESIQFRGDHWMAEVFFTLMPDDVPEGMHIPSIEVAVPIDPHGKSFEQVQREAIQLARGCIQEEALRAMVRLPR